MIDARGRVSDVKAKTETAVSSVSSLLETGAVKTIRQWTFHKPPYAPYTETIVFDYRLDETGRLRKTKVVVASPSHVTLLAPLQFVEP